MFGSEFFKNSSLAESRMKELTMRIHETMQYCLFQGIHIQCSELFDTVYTDAGERYYDFSGMLNVLISSEHTIMDSNRYANVLSVGIQSIALYQTLHGN